MSRLSYYTNKSVNIIIAQSNCEKNKMRRKQAIISGRSLFSSAKGKARARTRKTKWPPPELRNSPLLTREFLLISLGGYILYHLSISLLIIVWNICLDFM